MSKFSEFLEKKKQKSLSLFDDIAENIPEDSNHSEEVIIEEQVETSSEEVIQEVEVPIVKRDYSSANRYLDEIPSKIIKDDSVKKDTIVEDLKSDPDFISKVRVIPMSVGGGVGRGEVDLAIQTQAQDAIFTPMYTYSATTIKDALYEVDNRLSHVALSAGLVTSVFGRVEDVVAQSGDYDASQISYGNTNVSATLIALTNYDQAISANISANYYTKIQTEILVSSVSSTLNNELNNFTLNELSDVVAVSAQNYSMLTYVTSSDTWESSTVQWDDLLVPATQLRLGATQKPDFDFTNVGLLFPQNDATEQAYLSVQFSHKRKNGSDIGPHIHIIQTTSALPVFVLQYRWYMNGSIVPNYTTVSATSGVFPYTSGSMMQIMPFPKINGTSISAVSSQFDGIIWRNDNIVVGDVLFKQFDIHYQSDSYGGSRNEYSK